MDKLGSMINKVAGGGSGGYPHAEDDDDFRGAADHASRNAGSSGDESLFGTVLGALSQRKGDIQREDVDEDAAVRDHRRFFGGEDDGSTADSGNIGAAAAMQALKKFTSGESGNEGSSKSEFIGIAMSEASKLFDQQNSEGKVSSESSKESAIAKAGEMAFKFYIKSQMSGESSSSSGGGGGMSSLISLGSKFLAK